MVRRLEKHGNGVALVFDQSMLDALNMTPDTPVLLTLHAGAIIITPVTEGVPGEELEAALVRLRPRYKRMLENLASPAPTDPGS